MKINLMLPDLKSEYNFEDKRQLTQALSTLVNQLNFSYKTNIKNEQDTFNYFLS